MIKNISALFKWKYVFTILGITSFLSVDALAQTKPEVIYYNSGDLKLKAYIYKPEGKGLFPVYMWNHGSEKNPDSNISQARFWVKHGYIFFMPIRSGQSDNPGTYIVDAENQITRRKEMESVKWKQIYALHKKANDDVIAALSWIKNQPFADSNNIVVSGEGYGAIQVLLTADKDGQSSLGIKCFIVFSPTLGTWNTTWSDGLKQTINIAKRPIYLLQAKNDTNPSPIDSLGIDLNKKIYPNRYKLYPAQVGFSIDPKAWEKDVMQYLKDCGVRRRK